MLKLIRLAAQVAVPSDRDRDKRAFWLGAIGVRGDGVIVSARNGSVQVSETIGNGWSFPHAHAESRLCRKLDYGATVYVARVSPQTDDLAMSRPCYDCIMALRNKRVAKVYYSVSPTEYGVIDLELENEPERLVNR